MPLSALKDAVDIKAVIEDKDYIVYFLVVLAVVLFLCGVYRNNNFYSLGAPTALLVVILLKRGLSAYRKEQRTIEDMYAKIRAEIMERSKKPEMEIAVHLQSFRERFPDATEEQYRIVTSRLWNDRLLKQDGVSKEFYYMGESPYSVTIL